MNNITTDFVGWLKEDVTASGLASKGFWAMCLIAFIVGSGLGWLVWRLFVA